MIPLIKIPKNGKRRATLLTDPIWRNQHIALTRSRYVNRRAFNRLPSWQKRGVITNAVVDSTKTAIITGYAAADLYGIATLNLSNSAQVELVLPEANKPPSRTQWTNWIVYRNCYLPTEEISEVEESRTVSLRRLFVDIVSLHGELEGLAFLEAALNKEELIRKGFDKSYYQRYLDQNAGSWGIAKAQKVLDLALYSIQSPYETLARWLILKEPELRGTEVIPQAVIPTMTHAGLKARRLDLLLFGWLGIEIDGRMKYTEAIAEENDMTVGEFIQDERQRETQIQNMGYQFLRLSPNQISSQLIPLIHRCRSLCPKRKSPGKHYKPPLDLAYFERGDYTSDWESFHYLIAA